MESRMWIAFLFIGTLSCLLHTYLAMRLCGPLDPTTYRLARRSIIAVCATHALFFPFAVAQMPRTGEPLADLLQWVGWTTGGALATLLVLMWLKDLGWVALRLVDTFLPQQSPLPADPSRRAFLQTAANTSVLGATVLLSGAALIGARLRPTIERITLPIANLPDALAGLRIVQISDIHVGPTIKRGAMETLVAEVLALKPDLIAVTGDLVDGSVAALAEHVAPLAGLDAPLGTWFVTGNHEYYSGALPWCAHCSDELGMRVLIDEHAVVTHRGADIVVGGVADLHADQMVPTHRSDPAAAFEGAPKGDFRLLLAHQPESILATAGLGVHLQLSGHTHGGQYFPFTWLIRLVKKWSRGLHRVGDTWLYVNRGTTFWGPPMRLDSQQEVTVIELAQEE